MFDLLSFYLSNPSPFVCVSVCLLVSLSVYSCSVCRNNIWKPLHSPDFNKALTNYSAATFFTHPPSCSLLPVSLQIRQPVDINHTPTPSEKVLFASQRSHKVDLEVTHPTWSTTSCRALKVPTTNPPHPPLKCYMLDILPRAEPQRPKCTKFNKICTPELSIH